MPEKIGVYFDQASVSPYLNAEEMAELVGRVYANECPVVKVHPRLNSEEGRKLIQEDIDAGNVDAVCICGTSPRVDWDIFDFDNVAVERVNLREQCIKVFRNPDGTMPDPNGEVPELLKIMANEYVKMGVTKLLKTNEQESQAFDATKVVMVMGGGFTGLTAALYAAKTNHDVILVEKEATLGGKAAGMYKTFPLSYPYTEAHETGIEALISEVQSNSRIKVLTSAQLTALEGAPGKYTAKVKVGGNVEEMAVGACVLATGWVPQDTKYVEPMGYGSSKVVTAAEFEAMVKEGKMTAKSVAFVLDTRLSEAEFAAKEAAAADSTEEAEEAPAAEEGEEEETFVYEDMESYKHLPYTSELSSLVALKQANYVREKNDDAVAYIIYDHMMVPGVNERYYRAAQDNPGVMLTKGTVTSIKEEGAGMVVCASNTLLGENIEIEAELVVVPTGMVPTTAHDPTINLVYRQGPAFPDLQQFDGYADSNYICFPYETRRTGIYAAGCVRQPMSMGLAREDAAGAVLKAIQCINSSNHGVAVHPRSGDTTYPVFNFMRCTQCKRCTEECPFGALDDDEKGTPMPNPSRCRRCGTCMGACPERVIGFDNYNIDMIGSMIKQVNVPDDMEADGPRFIVLACENDAYPALDMAAMRGKGWSPYVRVVPVRCLGSVNTIWIADAMSKGIDGVLLLGCKYGEDYQCHFMKGSELCNRRMENVADSLNRLGVEPERVVQAELAIDEYDKVPDMIDNFVNEMIKIGPNPFKGY
ncbi:hydrogenase iron-sulfur subunit [Maridesulfovibrio salexigens]|uniref:Methyl-viologen-reducing hydrogenase delta subunit n=1 Tax=Maridesulfovibrio salexigens (strain ATCC 14822 / DSM 2638 / NCIMB 8403 / VKM B-1763) TaxID=526222 RepID=C6BVT5_MARSD|nr:hydrogenase iron-sulfur subunit [Maridesulfovibrio salexigens]ACS78299.1 methyl-viologen-reducing hydrogenase delta subunit [Maridesulfovibrio salexigens DSM 2638]